MPVAMTASVAAVVPVVATILGLLFACFVFIFALALLTRATGGPRRRVAFLVCAALVAFAAIRLVDGPWPGGRSFWPKVVSWRTHSTSEGDRGQTIVINQAKPARNGGCEGCDDAGDARFVLRDRIGEIVASAQSAAVAATESDFALSLRDGSAPPKSPVPDDTSAAPAHELSSRSVAHGVRSTARHVARGSRSAAHRLRSEVRELRTEVRRSAHGLRGWVRGYANGNLGGMLVTALALAAFLFVGYLFLDAGTRGQFTWSLRLVSLLAFVLFFAALALWPPS